MRSRGLLVKRQPMPHRWTAPESTMTDLGAATEYRSDTKPVAGLSVLWSSACAHHASRQAIESPRRPLGDQIDRRMPVQVFGRAVFLWEVVINRWMLNHGPSSAMNQIRRPRRPTVDKHRAAPAPNSRHGSRRYGSMPGCPRRPMRKRPRHPQFLVIDQQHASAAEGETADAADRCRRKRRCQ